MPRDALAYLSDIIESCDAISAALTGLDLEAYQRSRLVRSSVEREFIIIGEAISALSRVAPDTFASITHARRIVDTNYGTLTGLFGLCCRGRRTAASFRLSRSRATSPGGGAICYRQDCSCASCRPPCRIRRSRGG